MGKITFRADDDLVDELETFDVSKSEVMREALRSYLDHPTDAGRSSDSSSVESDEPSIDDVLADRIDDALDERLEPRRSGEPSDVTVRILLDSEPSRRVDESDRRVTIPPSSQLRTERADLESADNPVGDCGQCGMTVDSSHVYCPNCGEKATQRVFCECGDEVWSDWSFCPSCGRRTPAADVLDSHRS
ncbi:double zinc ribbon domain-containing protein [Halovivax gelatinilyticus]|uniref:double zinc ribbon domain-containing protein n=1 Tax=Halovivax gelatinilyticus TaxID=2961597 RepID=UPI0020CA9A8D|nr:zinc ribbon domain-containing protein [Halovivax gelatinilyticus]